MTPLSQGHRSRRSGKERGEIDEEDRTGRNHRRCTVVGLAGPAQADDGGSEDSGRDRDSNYYGRGGYYDVGGFNNPWIDQLVPTVKVPKVDTRVRN